MESIYDYIPVTTWWTAILMAHMLAAVALLGAMTHQALAVLAPSRTGRGFLARFRHVNASGYTGAIVVLWIATTLLGAWVYARYRIYVRMPMEQEGHWTVVGLFELKENIATVGLLTLPAYLFLWKNPGVPRYRAPRRYVTVMLAAIVWLGFMIGHIVVNVRGLGT